jgi:hypothetical protein
MTNLIKSSIAGARQIIINEYDKSGLKPDFGTFLITPGLSLGLMNVEKHQGFSPKKY